ncbi:asparagine synthetase B, partial [Bordetella hinzii]|nr:asparagine synthetase B [Bordetella hinzii]
MCGILGSWQFDAQARGDAEDALARALPLIRHRGPDDIGTAAIPTAAGRLLFGHTRLAIIDLSAAGHQPMIRGTLSVVFNGEIYNYRELRQELRGLGHSFSTDTDTEVLL